LYFVSFGQQPQLFSRRDSSARNEHLPIARGI
jgi:hypothetical protein